MTRLFQKLPRNLTDVPVTAREYRAAFYDYDNASYPGDVA